MSRDWPTIFRLGPFTVTIWHWHGPDWMWLRDTPVPRHGWRVEFSH